MTPEENAVIAAMTDEEFAAKLNGLSRYQRYDTVASCYDSAPMSPRQVKAWAAFADSLDGDVVMTGDSVYREKGYEALAVIVARNAIENARLEAERAAELASAIEFRAVTAHP